MTVVIGLGNAFRRDDGVGHAAVTELAALLPRVPVVRLDGEPTRIIDAWTGHRLAVVVDAIVAGDPPGTLHRVEVGVDPLPISGSHHSSHAAGLVTAVELSRALDRCPERLVVYGVEPADVAPGEGLSAPVHAALPQLVGRLADEVRAYLREPVPPNRVEFGADL